MEHLALELDRICRRHATARELRHGLRSPGLSKDRSWLRSPTYPRPRTSSPCATRAPGDEASPCPQGPSASRRILAFHAVGRQYHRRELCHISLWVVRTTGALHQQPGSGAIKRGALADPPGRQSWKFPREQPGPSTGFAPDASRTNCAASRVPASADTNETAKARSPSARRNFSRSSPVTVAQPVPPARSSAA